MKVLGPKDEKQKFVSKEGLVSQLSSRPSFSDIGLLLMDLSNPSMLKRYPYSSDLISSFIDLRKGQGSRRTWRSPLS